MPQQTKTETRAVDSVRDDLPNPSLTVLPQEWRDDVVNRTGDVSPSEVMDVANAVANSAQKRGDGKFSGGDAKKWYVFLMDVATTIQRLASRPDTGVPETHTPAEGTLRVRVSRIPHRLGYNVGAVVEVGGVHHINSASPASMAAYRQQVHETLVKMAPEIAERAVHLIEEDYCGE